jgi:hypothetical protein
VLNTQYNENSNDTEDFQDTGPPLPFWFSMNIPLPPDPDCYDPDDTPDQSHKDTQPVNGNQEEYANLG